MTRWLHHGSHDYKWPVEEAQHNEKSLARKVLHLDENGIGDEGQSSGSFSAGEKRKRPVEEVESEGKLSGLPPTKRSLDDPESLTTSVSGASVTEEMKPSMASRIPQHADDSGSSQGPPAIVLNMTVTSGFYVRSLCHDLGKSLGSLGVMSDLVRTRQGEFELGRNVLAYDDLTKGEDAWGPIIEAMLEDRQADSVVD